MTYKIYKITPCDENADENDVYYGSTESLLSRRMSGHRNDYRRYKQGKRNRSCASFSLFDKYGLENCKIVLVEEIDLDAITKNELKYKEADYIEQNKCVNVINPRPWTEEQKKECRKNYNKAHPVKDLVKLQKIKEYYAEWYQKNKMNK